MSNILENKKKRKLPFELVSNLLIELLDSKLSKLETKNKVEMNNIESMSQNTKIIINEIQTINKKVKQKIKTTKKITTNNDLNINKKTNIKISTKLNKLITCKKNENSLERELYSKIKTTKNNNIKNLKLNRSEMLSDVFLNNKINKSNTISIILNTSKRESKVIKKSKSKSKKKRGITLIPLTPSRKKTKGKEKSKYYYNNINLIKHSKTNTNLYNKYKNRSCKILPLLNKDKSKSAKNNELDLMYAPTRDDDKRIYDLNPYMSKIILNKDKNNKIKCNLFKRKDIDDFNKSVDNKELTLNDSLMNDVNNDELLIYYHDRKTMTLLDDITLTKSFFGDETDCDLDLDKNIENQNNLKNDNDNFTLAEKLELFKDNIIKYLSKEDMLRLGLINKEWFKIIMEDFISKRENIIGSIKKDLKILKNKNPDIIDKNDNNNNFTIKPFEYNNLSCRVIPLLDTISIESLFNNYRPIDINNKDIILVFDLFFIAIGYKKKILSFKNDIKSKWNFYKNIFEKNKNKNFGNFITNIIKGKIFDNDTINSLYEYSKNYINIITPKYFEKINNIIGLFVFIVKDILEHVGITKDLNDKKNVTKLYLLFNARISSNTIILQKLNKINSIISNKK